MDEFFEKNSKNFTIYSNEELNVSTGKWIPIGLLFRHYPEAEKTDPDGVLAMNDKIWAMYHDYHTTTKSMEASLLLKETATHFASGCARVGRYFFDEKKYEIARRYFEKGLNYDSEYSPNYKYLGMVQFDLKNCEETERNFTEYMKMEKCCDEDAYILMATFYRYCKKDEEKAKSYEEIYETMKKQGELKLEKL
jgi:tetratricopeptide (TPR) repeat protein